MARKSKARSGRLGITRNGRVVSKLEAEYRRLGPISSATIASIQNQLTLLQGVVDNLEIYSQVVGNTGSTTADSISDSLSILGSNGLTVAVTGDTVTVNGVALQDQIDALSARIDALEAQHTGWAVYRDTAYTSGSPFVISSGTKVTLPNNAGTVLDSELPDGVTEFYDGTKLVPDLVNNYYVLTVRFKASYSGGTAAVAEFGVDIGQASDIFQEVLQFPKGSGTVHAFSLVVPHYTGNDFVTNGGLVKLESIAGGNISVYGIEYHIAKVYPTN